jgi:hypothetical protein
MEPLTLQEFCMQQAAFPATHDEGRTDTLLVENNKMNDRNGSTRSRKWRPTAKLDRILTPHANRQCEEYREGSALPAYHHYGCQEIRVLENSFSLWKNAAFI